MTGTKVRSMKRSSCQGGLHAGVYVVRGPLGFEVGESKDVFERNLEYTRLGIRWTVARLMPFSTKEDRTRAEVEVAD